MSRRSISCVLLISIWLGGVSARGSFQCLAPATSLDAQSDLLAGLAQRYEQILRQQLAEPSLDHTPRFADFISEISRRMPNEDGIQGMLDAYRENPNALDALHAQAIYTIYLSMRHGWRPEYLGYLDQTITLFREYAPANRSHAQYYGYAIQSVKAVKPTMINDRDPNRKIRPMSRAFLLVDSLAAVFGREVLMDLTLSVHYDLEVVKAYVAFSNQIAELPLPDRVWAVALELFFMANHLTSETIDTDSPDLAIALRNLRAAQEMLSEDGRLLDDANLALAIGQLRFTSYFNHRFISPHLLGIATDGFDLKAAAQKVRGFVDTHAGSLRQRLKTVRKIAAKRYPNTHPLHHDPLLAGMKWYLWLKLRGRFLFTLLDQTDAQVPVETFFLARRPHTPQDRAMLRFLPDASSPIPQLDSTYQYNLTMGVQTTNELAIYLRETATGALLARPLDPSGAVDRAILAPASLFAVDPNLIRWHAVLKRTMTQDVDEDEQFRQLQELSREIRDITRESRLIQALLELYDKQPMLNTVLHRVALYYHFRSRIRPITESEMNLLDQIMRLYRNYFGTRRQTRAEILVGALSPFPGKNVGEEELLEFSKYEGFPLRDQIRLRAVDLYFTAGHLMQYPASNNSFQILNEMDLLVALNHLRKMQEWLKNPQELAVEDRIALMIAELKFVYYFWMQFERSTPDHVAVASGRHLRILSDYTPDGFSELRNMVRKSAVTFDRHLSDLETLAHESGVTLDYDDLIGAGFWWVFWWYGPRLALFFRSIDPEDDTEMSVEQMFLSLDPIARRVAVHIFKSSDKLPVHYGGHGYGPIYAGVDLLAEGDSVVNRLHGYLGQRIPIDLPGVSI